jgi:hypothetical protein
MCTHYHKDPSTGWAGLGQARDGVIEGPQGELIAAGSPGLRDPKETGIDHSPHAFGHYLSSVVAIPGMLGKLRRDSGDASHDFVVVHSRARASRQVRFSK